MLFTLPVSLYICTLQSAAKVSCTLLDMPWQCSICAAFNADDLQKILNHIGRCHRNDPNSHCICGIDGCALTFRKYYSWRKHIYRKHGYHDQNGNQTEQNNNQRLVANNFNIEDIAPDQDVQDQDVQDQVKRASALYLLKLQEECKNAKINCQECCC